MAASTSSSGTSCTKAISSKPATVKELLMASNKEKKQTDEEEVGGEESCEVTTSKQKRIIVFRPRGVGKNKQNIEFIAHNPRKRLHSGEKQILLNIFCKLQEEHPNRKRVEIHEFMEKLTGVSQKNIEMAENEYIKGKTATKPSRKGKGKPSLSSMVFCPEIKHSKTKKSEEKMKGTLSRMKNVDEFVKESLRRKIHEFLFRNEIPTKHKLNESIENDDTIPNFTSVTLFRTIKEIGFRYQKTNRGSTVLIERDDVAVWRRRYLRRIRQYRKDGKKIYYADETYVESGCRCGGTTDKVSCNDDDDDEKVESARRAFVDSYYAEIKQHTNDRGGTRFIVAHVGSSDGFLEGGLLTFQAKKSANDYQQMDGSIFEAWFGEILKMLEPNSVLVLDSVPYHCVKCERIPSKGWRKSDIQSWLASKQIPFTSCMIMSELLDLVNGVKHRYGLYNTDKLAREAGHVVLRLPPYYSDLNPIEMVWNQIKHHVIRHVRTFEPDQMERIIHEAVNAVTSDNWKSCIEKVKSIEQKFWDLGETMDNMDQEFVSDGTESESSDSSD